MASSSSSSSNVMEKQGTSSEPIQSASTSTEITAESVFSLYKRGISAHRSRCYTEAFRCFRALLLYLAPEPLLWIRITEACIFALYDDETTQLPKLSHIGHGASHKILVDNRRRDLKVLAAEGITLEFAGHTCGVAMSMVCGHSDIQLKLSAMCLEAFIAIKQGRYRYATQLTFDIICTEGATADTILRASVYRMECLMNAEMYGAALAVLRGAMASTNSYSIGVSLKFNHILVLCAEQDFVSAYDAWKELTKYAGIPDVDIVGLYICSKLNLPSETEYLVARLKSTQNSTISSAIVDAPPTSADSTTLLR